MNAMDSKSSGVRSSKQGSPAQTPSKGEALTSEDLGACFTTLPQDVEQLYPPSSTNGSNSTGLFEVNEDSSDARGLDYSLDFSPLGLPSTQDWAMNWPSLPEHRLFGDYELVSVAGHGGMGVIFKAQHAGSGQTVAVKIMRQSKTLEANEYKRFERECATMASLNHPNIMPILDHGYCKGVPYIVMPYIQGGTLLQRRMAYLSDLRGGAVILEKVVRAVAYAHQHGVLHRDLKTNNIMMKDRHEPLVSDFGLAKRIDLDPLVTKSGEVLGTMAYMPPEQASGRHPNDVNEQSDVWSLGVILYEVLCGELPFRENRHSPLAILIMTETPVAPNILNHRIDSRLEAIILRCLEKDRSQRYRTAAALADDLADWIRLQPHKDSSKKQKPLRRASRRNRSPRQMLSLVLLMLLVLIGSLLLIGGKRFSWKMDDNDAQIAARFQELREQLDQGRPVVLIDEEGQPQAYQITLNPKELEMHQRDGFFVQITGRAIIELLPAPMPPAYRLKADVKHVSGKRGSGVGLITGYELYQTDLGKEHFGSTIELQNFRLPTRVCQMNILRILEAVDQHYFESSYVKLEVRQNAALQLPLDWYQVSMDVTPTSTTVSWNGIHIGQVKREFDLFKTPHDKIPMPLVDLSKVIPSTGGVGLFLSNAAGHFRNVVIEPLVNGQ